MEAEQFTVCSLPQGNQSGAEVGLQVCETKFRRDQSKKQSPQSPVTKDQFPAHGYSSKKANLDHNLKPQRLQPSTHGLQQECSKTAHTTKGMAHSRGTLLRCGNK